MANTDTHPVGDEGAPVEGGGGQEGGGNAGLGTRGLGTAPAVEQVVEEPLYMATLHQHQ